jgi:hypothetical protein
VPIIIDGNQLDEVVARVMNKPSKTRDRVMALTGYQPGEDLRLPRHDTCNS